MGLDESGAVREADQGTGTGEDTVTPLRILLLSYEYPPVGGGGGVGVRMYAEAWVQKGHSVTVVTGWSRELPRYEISNGVEIIRVGALDKQRRATAGAAYMAGYLLGAARLLMQRRHQFAEYDVLNTHFVLPTGPVGWLASSVLHLPHVLTLIGGDVYDPTKDSSPHRHAMLRMINRRLMNAADSLIAISSDTAKRAREHYGIERDIEIVNYGFAPTAPSTVAGVDRGRFVLIGVGRLVERKGFSYLLRALPKLPEDISLWIVGDGPLDRPLADEAERLGVASRVRWFGYRKPAEIAWLLGQADCFVLSSLHEGMGIVVQEAMSAGLPVVATNNGGQVDLIQEGRNGRLVPPADPDALATAILDVFGSEEDRRRMGQNNLEDIARFDVIPNAARYVDVFRSLRPAP